jgi:phenol/toluene 2-monooxygenase (NADH) P0/A0
MDDTRTDAVAPPGFDPARRYVRLLQMRPDGFVEFEFAVGEPELTVELILPAAAYRAFCRDNRVTLLPSLRVPES